MKYKKSDIVSMSNEMLLAVLHQIGSQEVKEVNFGRGSVTNKTFKNREWVLLELSKRFGVDKELINETLNNL